jgi:hypothetical protein
MFLREGCNIVTRGTCFPASLKVNNLGKAAELLLWLGLCQTHPHSWIQLCLCPQRLLLHFPHCIIFLVWLGHGRFIHSPTKGHVGCLQVLAIMNKATCQFLKFSK